MTTGYQCERCSEWHKSPTGKGRLNLNVLGRPIHRDYSDDIDLCDDCEDDFAEFMGEDE